MRPTPASLALGIYGLFGYHALYFAALKLAPPAEASLIASLWALLTVLFSGLLPGTAAPGTSSARCSASAARAGLGQARRGRVRQRLGFVLAFACALVWSSYSASRAAHAEREHRRLLPRDLRARLRLHLVFEHGCAPMHFLAGAGGPRPRPGGGAFLLWDVGMKGGNVPLLGVLSYASPILSTALLVALGLRRRPGRSPSRAD